jgi:hypothetical protein
MYNVYVARYNFGMNSTYNVQFYFVLYKVPSTWFASANHYIFAYFHANESYAVHSMCQTSTL